jgi:nicotinate-nucleotide--dimethylbenzimidazole phosphoribosyltransferase
MADFGAEARAAIYEVIARRRDIRQFREQDLDEQTLGRILAAAHQAPSVGLSQPWDFIVIRDRERRGRIRESFLQCRVAEAARFPPERREKYLAYRLEGILESAVNVCVTVDLRPADEPVLGTTAQPESLRWSACCSVQNLWLAARAEGVGVGWVSIVEPAVLRAELGLPAGVEPVAYLCVGYPVEFRERPMLEETGWRKRRELTEVVHQEVFGNVDEHEPDEVHDDHHDRDYVYDREIEKVAREYQDKLCKPRGSLGRLEELAVWYAAARGRFPVEAPEKIELYVFAGDHGVVEEGVSAWPSSITAAMVGNFLAGGAAINQVAKECGAGLTVVDVGVAGDLVSLPREPHAARFVRAKVRAGTRNFAREPAMTRAEAQAAIDLGVRLARESGADLLAAGEMGIGNTTAAAALSCVLASVAPADAVGRGAGLDDAGVAHKIAVVEAALSKHRVDARDPLSVLATFGGLEIAAMAGLMIGGAAARVPVMVDGFISGAAALVAVALEPGVRDFLCLSHRSAERGHAALCAALGKQPLFDLGMRLGEGTGALLAAQLVRAAVRVQAGMATFSTAGIKR